MSKKGSETFESLMIKLSLSDDPEQPPRKPRSLYPVPRDRFDPSQNKVTEDPVEAGNLDIDLQVIITPREFWAPLRGT